MSKSKPIKWTTQDWVIRGLVMSHISAHTLYRWYSEYVEEHVSEPEFHIAMLKAVAEGLIFDAGDVTCYEHPRHVREIGWALTDKGMQADPTVRG